LPGIYHNIVENSKHFDSFRLFEIGREIHKRAEGLPDEIPHLVAAIYSKDDGRAGLLELKRAAECVAAGAEVHPGPARGYEHPARAADVIWQQRAIGRLAELHPSLLEGRAAVLDLDLRLLQQLRPVQTKHAAVRRYPSSAFDLSVIARERELAGDLQNKLRQFAGPLLEHIDYLREYTGAPLPEGTKSVSYRLTIGAADHTLSSDEVSAVRSRIIEGMRGLGYDLRV
jgi:phenylalanyl-tRNA synthetase beta chain